MTQHEESFASASDNGGETGSEGAAPPASVVAFGRPTAERINLLLSAILVFLLGFGCGRLTLWETMHKMQFQCHRVSLDALITNHTAPPPSPSQEEILDVLDNALRQRESSIVEAVRGDLERERNALLDGLVDNLKEEREAFSRASDAVLNKESSIEEVMHAFRDGIEHEKLALRENLRSDFKVLQEALSKAIARDLKVQHADVLGKLNDTLKNHQDTINNFSSCSAGTQKEMNKPSATVMSQKPNMERKEKTRAGSPDRAGDSGKTGGRGKVDTKGKDTSAQKETSVDKEMRPIDSVRPDSTTEGELRRLPRGHPFLTALTAFENALKLHESLTEESWAEKVAACQLWHQTVSSGYRFVYQEYLKDGINEARNALASEGLKTRLGDSLQNRISDAVKASKLVSPQNLTLIKFQESLTNISLATFHKNVEDKQLLVETLSLSIEHPAALCSYAGRPLQGDVVKETVLAVNESSINLELYTRLICHLMQMLVEELPKLGTEQLELCHGVLIISGADNARRIDSSEQWFLALLCGLLVPWLFAHYAGF